MTNDTPLPRDEQASPEPDLLWDCFTNWAEVLHELEVRKKEGTQPRRGSEF